MRSRQRGALILLGLLAVALPAAVVLSPARHPAVALAATNACKSNATGTYSDIVVGLTGTPTPSVATPGNATLTLSGMSFTAAVPATLLIAGYNLGLLTVGANAIPVKGWVAIAASNTTEGTQTQQFTTSVSTTITDPDGLPGTGDETATALSLNLGLGATTWSPTGAGDVAFSQGGPGTLPTIPAGQVAAGATTPVGGIYINAQVAGGLIKANFDCQGGTSAVGGATFTPLTPGSFAVAALSAPASTVPGSTVPGSTVPGSTVPGSTVPGSTVPGSTTPASTSTVPASTSTIPATTTTIPATTTTLAPTNGSASYSTSCKNSVTPDLSTLGFDATGTLPGQVAADGSFTLTKMKWKVTIPASVFQTGINLGLVTIGTPISGTIDLGITGTNTLQGTQDSPKIALVVPVAGDAAGKALPSTVSFDVPDMTWTARSGKIDMSMYGANVSVKIGLPNPVVFKCTPTAGAPFVSTTAVGVSTATTTTTRVASAAVAPTTTAAQTLVRTGPGGSLVVQIILALALLDLGYLTLSLRRSPRRAPARR